MKTLDSNDDSKIWSLFFDPYTSAIAFSPKGQMVDRMDPTGKVCSFIVYASVDPIEGSKCIKYD